MLYPEVSQIPDPIFTVFSGVRALESVFHCLNIFISTVQIRSVSLAKILKKKKFYFQTKGWMVVVGELNIMLSPVHQVLYSV